MIKNNDFVSYSAKGSFIKDSSSSSLYLNQYLISKELLLPYTSNIQTPNQENVSRINSNDKLTSFIKNNKPNLKIQNEPIILIKNNAVHFSFSFGIACIWIYWSAQLLH